MPKEFREGRDPTPRPSRFYIEGAEPGDTLVVHLLRLEINRSTRFSASLLAPYMADRVSVVAASSLWIMITLDH